jgi:hypothetical protein
MRREGDTTRIVWDPFGFWLFEQVNLTARPHWLKKMRRAKERKMTSRLQMILRSRLSCMKTHLHTHTHESKEVCEIVRASPFPVKRPSGRGQNNK